VLEKTQSDGLLRPEGFDNPGRPPPTIG
jgi:hypothetical protein